MLFVPFIDATYFLKFTWMVVVPFLIRILLVHITFNLVTEWRSCCKCKKMFNFAIGRRCGLIIVYELGYWDKFMKILELNLKKSFVKFV